MFVCDMTLSELLLDLNEKQVNLRCIDGELKIQAPKGKIPAELLQNIKKRKPELLQLLNSQQRTSNQNQITPVEKKDYYELSHSQKRFWLLDKISKASSAYNLFTSYYLEDLDIHALENALFLLVERHEILRTTFIEIDDDPFQKINESQAHQYAIELVEIDNVEDQKLIGTISQKEATQEFDLSTGPLIKLKALKLADNQYLLLLTMHHIVGDGWSMDILFEELSKLYIGQKTDNKVSLPQLDIQYKDFSAWQNSYLNGDGALESRRFWMDMFDGVIPTLELPTSFPRPAIKSFKGSSYEFELDQELTDGLRKITRNNDGTTFMGVVAALKLLLYKYSGQDQIVVGTPIAGRESAQLDRQIGAYINTLALRTNFSPVDNFEMLLSKVINNTTKAYEHQSYPFDRLIEDLSVHSDASRTPLFSVMIVHQNTGEKTGNLTPTQGKTNKTKKSHVKLTTSKFDLTFHFKESSNGINVNIEYSTDLFTQEYIERFVLHFNRITRHAIHHSDVGIAELDLLDENEKLQLTTGFNQTICSYPAEKTLHQLFEEQVALHPDSIAVEYENVQMTFQELNDRSNRLAHFLRQNYAIGVGDFVGLMVEKSEWMVIGIMGILKSGAAYVPINPENPVSRVEFTLTDCYSKVLITDLEDFNTENVRHCTVHRITELDALTSGYSTQNPEHVAKSTDMAYVIYTSGSTGKPKGVLVHHTGPVNRINWLWKTYHFSASDCILQKTPFYFDVSVGEIFMPLCYGAKLVLCKKEMIFEPSEIVNFVHQRGITYIHFVPPMLKDFLLELDESDIKKLASIKYVFASGEALTREITERFHEKLDIPLINLYGPTEASIEVSCYETKKGDQEIPIGKPIDNIQLYILDLSLIHI